MSECKDDAKVAYGCVFCSTGKEERVLDRMTEIDGLRSVMVPKQMKHHSEKGVKTTVESRLMPGYVFFTADKDIDIWRIFRVDNVIRLLSYNDGWELRGGDRVFAEWLFEHDGVLGMSKAYKAGEKVVVTEGPLKEFEGIIEKIDRHNRNGLITIDFNGIKRKVWLAFEYVTEVKA